ncbi:hypothetical protein V2J09_010766 [Rumex salicifolius]
MSTVGALEDVIVRGKGSIERDATSASALRMRAVIAENMQQEVAVTEGLRFSCFTKCLADIDHRHAKGDQQYAYTTAR